MTVEPSSTPDFAGLTGEDRREKDRVFRFFSGLRFLRDAGDPVAAGVLMMFAVAAGAILVVADDRAVVIQCAAGLVVCAGLYFTAVGLREGRADRYADRLTRALDQLGSDQEAVRVGAIRLLAGMLLENPGIPEDPASRSAMRVRKLAIREALAVVAREVEGRPAEIARDVLGRSY